jgi:nucleoside-diphosphate-sugar epimerase
MNLFVFGLGYTATRFIELYGRRFTTTEGTVRSQDKAQGLENRGISAFVFNDGFRDDKIAARLASADAVLISIPLAEGSDPVFEHFANTIASARPRWVGYLSTVGVYGDSEGGWIDEETAFVPHSARARQRVAAERAWLDLGDRVGVPVHIFRLAGIYGPGRNALERVLDGTARRIVKPDQVFNRIHVDDIAQVLMASIRRPNPGMIYNVSDDEPGPPQDVIAYAAELLGREAPPEIPFAEAELSPMARAFYEDNKRVRNRRIKEGLGVELKYPTYRHGLQALLASRKGKGAG